MIDDLMLTEDEVLAIEQERVLAARPMGEGLRERLIPPVLSKDDYKKQEFCYQLPETPTEPIEPNVVYRDEKTRDIKFLLLPKTISLGTYLKALEALQKDKRAWKKGGRKAAGQVLFGKKITQGWIDLGYPNYLNVRTAPTLEHPKLLAALWPLLREMNLLLQKSLPQYFDFALDRALSLNRPTGEEDDLSRVKDTPEYKEFREIKATQPPLPPPEDEEVSTEEVKDDKVNPEPVKRPFDPLEFVENIDPWDMTYTLRGTVFTTVELNRNIVFKAHEDGNNIDGTLVCIAALGSFVGGRLVFPRYGYSAELGPYDLLICDNNHELHGNLGPIVGERFSVVAFMHNSLQGRGDSTVCPDCGTKYYLDWQEHCPHCWLQQDDASQKRQPRVWDCHAGKDYPADAVYVGCRVRNRRGGVVREGSIFGNGTNPLVSHRGALHSESEFRAYAIEKLKDPAFRAEAEKLRGKDLLCWCVQEGPNRDEFCHARVWLDLINNPEGLLARPELFAAQRRDFDWGYYEPNFLSKQEADALFEVVKAPQHRFRPIVKRSGHPLRRLAGTTWSVRDQYAESIPLMVPITEAPPEIVSLQRKLSDLAGKDVNYFSLVGYENEKDHIDFHQHREDKCRDARVFIISLGERRSFAVDELCPECLLCDACNQRRCHPDGPPCSSPAKCKAAKRHRKICVVRKNTKTVLQPEHGSLIFLTSEANDWYEHAVLDDKEPKELRISINTKCIPPEDAAAGYVPRELRHGGRFAHKSPARRGTIAGKR